MRRIVLPERHADLIVRAARAAAPREYCAAMLGRAVAHANAIVVTGVVRLRNCDGRPGRFAVSDADLHAAELAAQERAAAIVALLHSHPTSAPIPSRHDLEALAYAQYPWVIVTAITGAFAAYAAGTGQLLPVQVDQVTTGIHDEA